MRILLWHGYLLGGTGSNVYTRALAREWSRMGHDVVVLCQEPHPERYDVGSAPRRPARRRRPAARLRARPLRGLRGQAAPGLHARRAGCAGSRRTPPPSATSSRPTSSSATTSCSVAPSAPHREPAMRSRRTAPSSSTRCAEPGAPEWGREVARAASAVFVGSGHIREVLEDVCGHVDLVHEVPPGVDIDEWRAAAARGGARGSARRGLPRPAEPGQRERAPSGRGQRRAARLVPRRRCSRRSSTSGSSSTTRAFTSCSTPCARSTRAPSSSASATTAPSSRRWPRRETLFTGPLEHRHLVHLLALADVTVVPSIFPEAFGMVAAEAAAAGSPPIVARHSGLAEIAEGLEAEYPEHLRDLASFTNGDAAGARREAEDAFSRYHRRTDRRCARARARPPSSAGAGPGSRAACCDAVD